MNKYLIMPEDSKWFEVEAMNFEMAYRGISNWFRDDRRIAVMDERSMKVSVYSNGFLEIYDE